MDRLLSMRAFSKVAALSSFSRAAEELELSSAVVSRLISDLEQHVNTRLLNRSTRCVNLTEAGEEYFLRCQRILELIDEADSQAAGLYGHPTGKLRVLVSFSEGLQLLAAHLPEFKQKYPDITLNVHLAERTVDIVQEHFDIAIQPECFVFSKDVVVRQLMSARLIVCASPAYLAAHGTPMVPADIAEHDCVGFSHEELQDRWPLIGPSGEVVVTPKNVLVSNNLEAIHSGLFGGMGLGLAFKWLVDDALQSGKLINVLPEYHVQEVNYFIVYPSRKNLPAKVRVMIEFLKDIFKKAGSN